MSNKINNITKYYILTFIIPIVFFIMINYPLSHKSDFMIQFIVIKITIIILMVILC